MRNQNENENENENANEEKDENENENENENSKPLNSTAFFSVFVRDSIKHPRENAILGAT